MTQNFNNDWWFSKNDKNNFQPVTLPHDWLIYDVNNLYETSVGYYSKTFNLSDFDREKQRVFINFDGVYMDSKVEVNGQFVGEWKYGYTAFEFELTDFVNVGDNTIIVAVDFKAPNSRWYSGAGIYRDVELKITEKCRIKTDGVYVTPKKNEDGSWVVKCAVEVECCDGVSWEVKNYVEGEGGVVIRKPKVWDIDCPDLYTFVTELYVDGKLADTERTRFGLREIKFDKDKGFFLNGRHLKLNGVCLHHDLGLFGAETDVSMIERQMLILKDMGVNAVRTSHNPPSKVFMRVCEDMGVLVLSEISDVWAGSKTKFDYARFFDEWLEKDVESWVKRDRNSPAVIMWSAGNEIYDTHADAEKGTEILLRIKKAVESWDYEHHAIVTLCSNYMAWENTQKCVDVVDAVGYNYGERLYDEHHKAHPNWVIFGSETGSTLQSRGVYRLPYSKSSISDDDRQCSALGNSTSSWGAKDVESFLLDDLTREFSLGQFIWAGWDYIGEPTPYQTKNCYFGHVDTAGFPKDSYFIIKSAWTSFKDYPFVHIFPYWDFSEGQLIDVRVCSNAPAVELFFEEKSLGKFELGSKKGAFVGNYQVAFKKGTSLRAVAYDETGEIVAEDVKETFGDVVEVKAESESWNDLTLFSVNAYDWDGKLVENANCAVNVEVIDGTLIGLDNGDSTDFSQYRKSDVKRLFNGKLLAVVRNNEGKTPQIKLKIDENDVPVRKIELTKTLINDVYEVQALILPENSTYKANIEWRLTDDTGINSPLGKLVETDDKTVIKVEPIGDGRIFVRCCAKNGNNMDFVSFISLITIDVTGLGLPFINPYQFVEGGLANYNAAELSPGFLHGVCTNEGVAFGFENVDFGTYGSDEVVLPLYSVSREPFYFEIWTGKPDEDGEKLLNAIFDKGETWVWNSYQDETYKLPKRISGVKTLSFVFKNKIHMRGFKFKKLEKAYETLYAAENDMINGDNFKVVDKNVEQIGANVTVLFKDMDFGEDGAKKIEICYRAELEKNSVTILFGDDSEQREIVEVLAQKEYGNAIFDLNSAVVGKKDVSLVFLPGTNLDLASIRFIK